MYKPRFLVNTYINPDILDIYYKDSDIARICMHEAGHAVISTVFGGKVHSVVVNTDGSGEVRGFWAENEPHDMRHMAGFFFESLICGRYDLPFPEPYPVTRPDVVNTLTGNTDKVIRDLERLVILNDFVVKAVEDTTITLFRSGLTLDGDEVRGIWNNSRNGRVVRF